MRLSAIPRSREWHDRFEEIGQLIAEVHERQRDAVKSSPLELYDLVGNVARAPGYSEAAESAGNAFFLDSHRSRERGLSGARILRDIILRRPRH